MSTLMTPDEEYAFYARPENQESQGPARRRDGTRLSAPVRFPPEMGWRCGIRPDGRSAILK